MQCGNCFYVGYDGRHWFICSVSGFVADVLGHQTYIFISYFTLFIIFENNMFKDI